MNILGMFSKNETLNKVKHKNKLIRLIIFFISCFVIALIYNTIYVKYDIVIGGMSGLAIVVKKMCGLSTTVFINISTIILLILSYFTLGKEKMKNNIIGSLSYPVFVMITEPIAKYININFNSLLFTLLFAALIYGIFMGIIYKVGYSTGGSDIINQIMCKYFKISMGNAGNFVNITIISTSLIVFGFTKIIYALFSLILINKLIDYVLLGNSDSKLCIIKTKNVEYLEEFLINNFNIGYSILKASGGLDHKKRRTIMCVVASREYFKFKNLIMDIDPHAFFATHDCYEVLGGNNKRIINFN